MEKLKIQSVGDIITNSSSEVFVIKCEDSWEEVEKDILSWKLQDQCSGMGGEISVYDNKRPYDTESSSKYEDPLYPWLAEGYLAVDIDWNMKKHIDKLFKKYDVVGSEEADLIYNTQSKKYRRFTDEDRKKGISQEESILLAGGGEILKMQKEYYSNLMKESEEAINKIYGMDEAKKAHKLWSDYMHSQSELEILNINEEEYKTDTLSANDDMHKKYKKSSKTKK